MKHLMIRCLLCCLIMTIIRPVPAADKKPKAKSRAVIDASQADADFTVQGEYAGILETEDGKVKFGVQIIALGDGKFHAVAYRGGLPGDGWDGREKIEADGETSGGETKFVGDKATGIIKAGSLTVQDSDGRAIGTLRKVVRKSATLGKKPPADAVVLFDGKSAEKFKGGRLTKNGLLQQGMTSRQAFGGFTLHLEFLVSYMPHERGQKRGNSGCYMQGRYEVQILDSFGLAGKHNECGGIYSIKDPDVNMCFPPLSWQTYDVDFTAAKYDDGGKKTADARMTVRHNGVVIHKDVAVPKTTTAAPVKEGPEPGPVYIQDHGNPLRFRNIWLVERK